MSQPIQIHNHPFRFLLHLEWVLLVIAILSEASPYPFFRSPREPLLMIFSMVGFGVMGLRIPTGNKIDKVIYTTTEILLIVLTVMAGGIRLFPLLYIVLVIRSCLIFELPERLLITGLSFFLFIITLLDWLEKFTPRRMMQERLRYIFLGYALLFALSLAFVLLLMNALLTERQSREKLAVANEQLRQYALRIENQATLQERNRIARDIHDSLGHSLTALNLQLETALKLLSTDPAKATTFLAQAKRLGSTALQDVRNSVSAMRSDPLQGKTLQDAITSLILEFGRSTGITPISNLIVERPIPPEMTPALYRIVQEALTNICKYAAASEIKIQLQTSSNQLKLIIEDNGKGFNVNQNMSGFGLQGMRERTLALGGTFEINTAPEKGCKITAKFKLHNP